MNFGDCPYDGCSGFFSFAVPDKTPCYIEIACKTCLRPVWYRLSRIDPMAWTKEDFEKEFIVDREAKTIAERAALTL